MSLRQAATVRTDRNKLFMELDVERPGRRPFATVDQRGPAKHDFSRVRQGEVPHRARRKEGHQFSLRRWTYSQSDGIAECAVTSAAAYSFFVNPRASKQISDRLSWLENRNDISAKFVGKAAKTGAENQPLLRFPPHTRYCGLSSQIPQ